jgi:hypothetical protein
VGWPFRTAHAARARAAADDYHALRVLARWLAEQDRGEELRELVTAAGAGTRLLIFDAAGEGGSAGTGALRVLADLGDNTSRLRLARRLARDGQLEELRASPAPSTPQPRNLARPGQRRGDKPGGGRQAPGELVDHPEPGYGPRSKN